MLSWLYRPERSKSLQLNGIQAWSWFPWHQQVSWYYLEHVEWANIYRTVSYFPETKFVGVVLDTKFDRVTNRKFHDASSCLLLKTDNFQNYRFNTGNDLISQNWVLRPKFSTPSKFELKGTNFKIDMDVLKKKNDTAEIVKYWEGVNKYGFWATTRLFFSCRVMINLSSNH